MMILNGLGFVLNVFLKVQDTEENKKLKDSIKEHEDECDYIGDW